MPSIAKRDTSGTFALRAGERHEVERLRTRTSKTFRLTETLEQMAAGLHAYRVGCQIGPVHYPDDVFAERPRWREIDCEIRRAADDDDADWAMTEAGYQARFWQSSTKGKAREAQALSYIGEFSRGGATYRMAPLSLSWMADGAEEAIATPVAGIDPVLDPDGYSITWPDAFGKGLDYGYNTRPDHFFKALTIRDRSALPEPSIKATHLMLRLWVSWGGAGAPDNGLPAVAAEYRGDSKGAAARHTPQARYAHKRADGRECFWLREPEAWDSADEPRRWPLEWWYETRGKEVVLALALPVEALAAAQYPLTMDTDIAEEQVGASTDDAFSTEVGCNTSGSKILISGSTGKGWTGTRFTTVPLTGGVTISAATIQYYQAYTGLDDMAVTLYCADEDNTATYSTSSGDFPYDRPATTAQVSWLALNIGKTNDWRSSPDISSCVQEVIDRDGWSSGNALAVIAQRNNSYSAYNFYIRTYDYTGNTYGAKLNVSYTVPAEQVTSSSAVVLYSAGETSATRSVDAFAGSSADTARDLAAFASAALAAERELALYALDTELVERALQAYGGMAVSADASVLARSGAVEAAERLAEAFAGVGLDLARLVETYGAGLSSALRSILLQSGSDEQAERSLLVDAGTQDASERDLLVWAATPPQVARALSAFAAGGVDVSAAIALHGAQAVNALRSMLVVAGAAPVVESALEAFAAATAQAERSLLAVGAEPQSVASALSLIAGGESSLSRALLAYAGAQTQVSRTVSLDAGEQATLTRVLQLAAGAIASAARAVALYGATTPDAERELSLLAATLTATTRELQAWAGIGLVSARGVLLWADDPSRLVDVSRAIALWAMHEATAEVSARLVAATAAATTRPLVGYAGAPATASRPVRLWGGGHDDVQRHTIVIDARTGTLTVDVGAHGMTLDTAPHVLGIDAGAHGIIIDLREE